MAGKKTQAKNQQKDKKEDVLTHRSCEKCGERMLSKQIRTTLLINFVGAKSNSRFAYHHVKCA
jgi:ssDNA-binding Zn-finger/Zn-ribbon topoisomerase 1